MRALLFALPLAIFPLVAHAGDCALDRIWLRQDGRQAQFRIRIADDEAARAQGLMFVENMPAAEGMLFLFERPQRAVFWMKNTLIPLDMLFLSARGEVVSLHERAEPLSEAHIDGGADVAAVLEINGGLARRLGLGVGAEAQHPAFGSNALWPCMQD